MSPSDDTVAAARSGSTASKTRAALIRAGHKAFAERGYEASRLADITAESGVTTGAFYRHFNSKSEFFKALFDDYGRGLVAELETTSTLRELIEGWLAEARRHRGVVRAAQELSRVGSEEAEAQRQLRATLVDLVRARLEPDLGKAKAEPASHVVVDMATQYVVMEAAGWSPKRSGPRVAAELERLVETGLYR